MKFLPWLGLSFVGAAFLACGASHGNGGAGSGGSGGVAASTSTIASSGSKSASAGGASSSGTDAKSSSTGQGGGFFNPDAGFGSGGGDDGGGCKHLNIGIFGNPGADPSANFQAWLESAGTSVSRILTTPGEQLDATTLQPFDVVILDWLTRDYTAQEAQALSTFISSGKGLVSMTGYDNNTTDDWHANSLLAPMSVAYSGPLLNGPVTSFATHPITAGLTSVTFNGGYAISDLGGAGSTRTPIAFLDDGMGGTVDVGFAIQMGMGHAFVWGDEWIEFDSEWSTLPQIKQFWVQIFAWISPTNSCAINPPS